MTRCSVCLPLALISWLGASPALVAQSPGDLTVTPTRIVFEGRTRAAALTLVNRGNSTATYRIGFVELRMDDDGKFSEVTEPAPAERSAEPLVRFSPRQVTLEAGASQTVRLMLRKPAELAAGEYRSHLALHALPPDDVGRGLGESEPASDEIGIRLIPIFRFTLPVIVRHGELAASAGLDDAVFEPAEGEAGPAVSLRLRREGSRSLFGDLAVTFVPDGGGAPLVVGEVKGLAVYTPNTVRGLRLPLAVPAGVRLEGGRLEIDFAEPPGDPAGGEPPRAAVTIPLS